MTSCIRSRPTSPRGSSHPRARSGWRCSVRGQGRQGRARAPRAARSNSRSSTSASGCASTTRSVRGGPTRPTHPSRSTREVLDELFELARWAPNHHLTNPWRFRVIGRGRSSALKVAAGPEAATKLDRAPTLVVCSCVHGGRGPVAGRGGSARDRGGGLHRPARRARPRARRLLAHARGACVRPRAAPRWASATHERFVALLYLGHPVQDKARARARAGRSGRHLPR